MDVFLFLMSLIMDIMLGKYLCIYLFSSHGPQDDIWGPEYFTVYGFLNFI